MVDPKHPRAVRSRATIRGAKSRKATGALLDRLLLDEKDGSLDREADPIDATIRSIKRNLGRILNAQTADAAFPIDLGAADLNADAGPSQQSIREICASIKKCIELREPRIQSSNVVFLPDAERPHALHFAIEASITVSGAVEQIRIDLLAEQDRVWRFV